MLSADLFREIRPEFLRLLGAKDAAVYLDAADEMESELALRAGALSREEALALVERVVERHGDVEIEEAVGLSLRELG